MASSTSRRMPSARPPEPCSLRSCRTVFKSSGLLWWVMWLLMLDVFADTPTGNQHDPPSTSFSRAERLHPSGVRLRSARYARLRSASPRRGGGGGKKDKLQKDFYTPQANWVAGPADRQLDVPRCSIHHAGHPALALLV